MTTSDKLFIKSAYMAGIMNHPEEKRTFGFMKFLVKRILEGKWREADYDSWIDYVDAHRICACCGRLFEWDETYETEPLVDDIPQKSYTCSIKCHNELSAVL